MPTSYEFGGAKDQYADTNGWAANGTSGGFPTNNLKGTAVMPRYLSNSNGHVSFPYAGDRNASGMIVFTGGWYWSGSIKSSTDSYCARLGGGAVMGSMSNYSSNHAMTVRCVKNN
jgi:hypothetical protein